MTYIRVVYLQRKYDKDSRTHILKATRNFDEYEFVIEVSGTVLNSSDGQQRSLQTDCVDGKFFFAMVLLNKINGEYKFNQ